MPRVCSSLLHLPPLCDLGILRHRTRRTEEEGKCRESMKNKVANFFFWEKACRQLLCSGLLFGGSQAHLHSRIIPEHCQECSCPGQNSLDDSNVQPGLRATRVYKSYQKKPQGRPFLFFVLPCPFSPLPPSVSTGTFPAWSSPILDPPIFSSLKNIFTPRFSTQIPFQQPLFFLTLILWATSLQILAMANSAY